MYFKGKNIINFYCKSCNAEFDCNVGKINFETEDGTPEYEEAVVCNLCGAKYSGKGDNFSKNFELTEIGQSQMTALFLGED